MSSPPIYKHTPLSSTRSIRVLNLKGTSRSLFRRSTTENVLKIELEEVSLDSSPSYEALSYTWDDQVPDRPVSCHGKIMKVTKNCEIALLRLRNQSGRRLWVDSICINQDSVLEKNTQIPLMGEIYGKCSRVLVWLGEGTEASDCGFRYLRDIARLCNPLKPSMARVALANINSPISSAYPRLPHEVEQEVWQRILAFKEENKQMYGVEGFTIDQNILLDIFNRPWFSRMWTIQELALGPRASILCGQSELLWFEFLSATSCLAAIEQKNTKLPVSGTHLSSKLKIYEELRSYISPLSFILGPRNKNMSKILALARTMKSWDPRDKMYALYGYLTVLGITSLPPVDYNLPVAKVYLEFTKTAMLHDQSIDLLYRIGCKHVVQGLPSWCPDWSTYTAGDWPILHEHSRAAKNSNLRFVFAEERELHLPAIVIDTVKKRPNSSMPPEVPIEASLTRDVYLPNMIQRVQIWLDWIDLASRLPAYPTGREDCDEALFKTLIQNGYFGSLPHHKLSDQVLEEYPIWGNLLQAYRPNRDHKEILIGAIDHAVEMALDSPEVWKMYFSDNQDPLPVINTPEWRIMIAVNVGAQNIHQWIFRMTAAKTIFITEKGYIGIGSDLIQEGDKVILSPGFNVPMIVRECEDGSHHFVAPAYIHGVMDGEKWPDNEADVLTYFVFK